ncbi:structural determinants For improved thermal stability of designed ankyrin repeat protein with A redesigned C capping module [Lepidopterella palustris CBS 459.81]|uniref:Structural determinants For improved thermal stability of designed ankyrin repeat protein with A redesigned C capping module n=1 Tax=Lepidopterella palustris CBS 459.81 TaxID=1314670 RepID=A0A8E2EAR9_9PEZI|nr:structural determinants For improved thermal stability of designed ankyrin repeat protein with A redesigned C capping module [Lepidopterella palustris CBS 459.81]
MVELLLRYGVSPDSCDERRQTPLHGAAWVGNDEAVSILHKAGADIDWADELGRTPLMKAAYCCRERAVETLLDCGAEVNAQDEVGLTALHLALRTGYIFQDFSCIRILLSKGASIRAVDCSGMSPWDVANELGEPEIIRLVESARDQRLVPQE